MSLSARALLVSQELEVFLTNDFRWRKPGSVAWHLAAGGSWGSQTGERTRLVMILDARMRGVFFLYQIPKEKNPS